MSVDLVWRSHALFPIVLLSASFALSAFLITVARHARHAHLLALIIAIESVAFGGEQLVWHLTDEPEPAYAASMTIIVLSAGLPFLYLAFLGSALRTPLVRPFKGRRSRVALFAAAALAPVFPLVFPRLAVDGAMPDTVWTGQWTVEYGPFGLAWFTAFTLVVAYGLVCAISAFRRAARASLERRRARAFVAAFGTRDVLVLALYVISLWARSGTTDFYEPTPTEAAFFRGLMLVTTPILLLYYGLLATAIVRHQLLGVDVTIKWTIRRGTLVGVFIATFYVVTILAENFFQRYGLLFGSVAAGLLLFALTPLQRFADRVADKAMPGVKAPGEMSHDERRRMFREMATSAWADGNLSRDERRMLSELRQKLGIPADEAERIEKEVAAG